MDPRKAYVFRISDPTLFLMLSGHPDLQQDPERVYFGVCHPKFVFSWHIHVVNKLDHNSTSQDKMRSRTSPDGLLLF